MSQPNPPKKSEPVLHHYDPQQPVVLPKTGGAAIPPQASTDVPASTMAPDKPARTESPEANTARKPVADRPVEIGGPSGPEPTRYGDWERNGRVSDF